MFDKIISGGLDIASSIWNGHWNKKQYELEEKKYREEKGEIKIDVRSQSFKFRNRKEDEERAEFFFQLNGEQVHGKFPEEILVFCLYFLLKNTGRHKVGIDIICIDWEEPFESKEKFMGHRLFIHGPIILNPQEQRGYELTLDSPPYCLLKIEQNKESYLREYKEEYPYVKNKVPSVYARLPKRIALIIWVRTISGETYEQRVPFEIW